MQDGCHYIQDNSLLGQEIRKGIRKEEEEEKGKYIEMENELNFRVIAISIFLS